MAHKTLTGEMPGRPVPDEPVDVSVFSDRDLANIVLQRSEVLSDVPRAGRIIRSWSSGRTAPLLDVVAAKGGILAERAVGVIGAEFRRMENLLEDIAPKSVADIGCGYAIFDLFLLRRFNPQLTLIDLEDNDHRHFGFEAQGAAYSKLRIAERFLRANCEPPPRITLKNPSQDDIFDRPQVDLAVSFLACGFHFPVDVYMPFFTRMVRPGGHILLDLRKGQLDAQLEALSPLGETREVSRGPKSVRVQVLRSG